MGTQIHPTYHPSEFEMILDSDLLLDMNSGNARKFMTQILETHEGPTGGCTPADILLDSDAIMVRASMLDIVDPSHLIEGYWQFQASALLSIAEWADRNGRDVVWS